MNRIPCHHRAVALHTRSAGGRLRRLAPVIALGGMASASAIGLMATSGWLITRAAERPPILSLAVAIGAVQAFALGRGLARYGQRLRVHALSLDRLGDLRLRLFDALEPLVPGGLPDSGGSVLTGFVSDSELVAQGFAKRLTAVVDVGTALVVGGTLVGAVDQRAAATLVIGTVATVLIAVALARVARPAIARELVTRADVAATVVETMKAAPELIAFGREDILAGQLASARRRGSTASRRRALATGAGRALTTIVAALTVIAVVLAAVGAHHLGRLSGVAVVAVTFVTLAVLEPVTALPGVLADTMAARAAADRISMIASREPPVREPTTDSRQPEDDVGAALDRVDVAGRSFDGDPERTGPVVTDVSLSIEPGARWAIVGPSGSGKTTVLHALLHFVGCSAGTASIGGVDVGMLSRRSIARHLGWMADHTHVFSATLRDNLRLGRPSASDSDCRSVLGRVGLDQWMSTLPDGLDTMLGAGGRPVSAGERQRLGMARTVLTEAPIVLLDEPTAHLDPRSARTLLKDLLGSAKSRAVVVVSHEPGIESQVDQVLRLEGGRVVASGRESVN